MCRDIREINEMYLWNYKVIIYFTLSRNDGNIRCDRSNEVAYKDWGGALKIVVAVENSYGLLIINVVN